MKKSLLFFFGFLLLMTGLVSAQDTQVDKRILNNLYWMNMAERGLAKLNPDIPPPPSSYLGRSITPPNVLGGDSPDVLTSDDPNITQSENSGFVNPLDDDKVINSNNSTNWPVTLLYGTSDYQTSDGGLTWAGTVSLTGAGNNSGDPSAAIDLGGRYYVNFINPSFGISTAYSTNEGASWTNSVVHSSGNDDKNHVWPDNSSGSPYEGNIYTDWTDFGVRGGAILISRSTNGGINWSSSIDVSLAAGGIWGQGANVQTGPNGEVYAIWAIYDNPYPSDETAIGMAKSTDGGVTYGTSTRIINGIRGVRTQGTDNGGPIPHRVNSFPSGAVDISGGPHAGWVYAVWTNHGVPGVNTGNDLDVYVIRSTNGGSTWSTPIRVNQDPIGAGKRHYEAWMSCDPITGSLSVIWYDNRNTSGNAVETWVGTSIDGGNTWENFRVSDVSFTPAPIPGLAGGYMGDYLNICSRGGKVYPFWADNRNGVTLTYTSPFLLATNIGWVDGTVTSGGNPLEGVDIDFVETGFIQVPGTSDAAGHYLAGAEVDTGVGSQNYTLRAQKFGYTTYTAPLTLVLNDTITHNFSMSTAPGGTLMVHAHTSDGSGVGAAVDVFLGGTVVLSGNTDPGTGDFTTPLPSGTYDVTVNPPDPYATVLFTGVVITANQTTNLDALMEPYVLFEDRIDSLSLSIEGGAKDSIQFYVRNNGIQSGDFSAQVVLFPRAPLEGGTAPITIPLTVYPSKVQRTTHVADYPRGNFAASAGLAPRQALLSSKKKDGATPSLRGPVGTAYAISANLGTGAEELYSFNLGTPDMFRYIADMGSPEFFAGDFGADGLLYVLDYNTNQLATVDTSTGVATFIGSSFPNGAETWTGLTWDNSTGTWYASSTDITRSTLYTVDPSTGTTTIVGELTGSPGNIDVSADNTGQLYGYDIVSDMFYSVDKGTGTTTTLGPIGFDASFAQGMDFDPATNICYMAAFNVGTFQGELRTVDLSTGSTTLVGTFPNQEVTVVGVAGSYGGVWLTLVPKSGTIAPGDSVLMTARFDATDPKIYENPGDYFGRVDIKSTNSPAPDTLSIPAKMFVVPPPGARLTLLPTSLNFGDVQVYDNKTLSVRIKNIGASTLDVTDITTTDPLYTVQPPTSFSVASLDTHRVFVTFTAPFPAGTYDALMNFTSNDPLAPSLPMTADAFGVPHFVDRIDSLQLDIEGGLTDSLQFFMSNDGTEDGTFHARAILTPQNLAAGKVSRTFEIPVSLTSANGEVKLAKSRNSDEVTVASKKKATNGTTNRSNSLGDYPRGKFGASAGPAPRSAFKVGNARKKGGSPSLSGPSTTAYAISANLSSGEEELYSFNVATPDMFRYIADMGSAEYFAGDFGPDGFLYGLNYFTNQLATIDTSTGIATIIGSSIPNGGETWTGLTYDNSTATWYSSSGDGVRSTLYTVDPTTGQTTIVGEMTGSPLNIDISADNTGQIYGYDIVTDLFYSVDKGTGATTNIGPIGFDASFAQGMDFDPATNTCYMAAFNVGSFQGELRTVDLFTGSTTLIGTFPNEEVTVVGIAGVFGTPWLSISPTSGTVAIGDSVVMTAHFDATDPEIYENPGSYFGEVRVTATDPFADTLSIPVRLYVERPLGARLIPHPASIDYGDVEIGASSVASVLVTNIGLTTLDVTNITTDNSNFVVTAPTSFSLVTGDTHRVYVSFNAPAPAGEYSGTMTFTCNDPSAATVALTGTSAGVAHITANPNSFAFTINTTDTTRATMTLYNPGTGQLSFEIHEGAGSLSASASKASIERSRQQQPGVGVPQKGKDASGPGQPPVAGMGGPDEYGYVWIDSDEPGGPAFEWVDITGVGTPLTMFDDDNQGPFGLGFNFNFYGTSYNSVRVCSNGFLSFTSTVANYTNGPIPSSDEPNNAIYTFWDDMNPSLGGTIHYYADATNNRFIVQYTNIQHYSPPGGGPYTYEVIIQANGDIITQYLSILPPDNSATIGIENSNGTTALQVVFDATYVHDNLAILFTTDVVPWMSADPATGTIDPGDSLAVEVRVHAAGFPAGDYSGNFIVGGNTPDVLVIPVTMDLTTSVPDASLVPTVFGLSQNYPNPFNPTTRIKYTLPEQSTVSLKIYNLLGQEMVSIASGIQEAGFYELTWDGRNSRGTNVGSGVYFYRFEATGSSGKKFTDLKKMLFLK